jgi:Ser/Thr protein kinase RdoA (MazF antagonist)
VSRINEFRQEKFVTETCRRANVIGKAYPGERGTLSALSEHLAAVLPGLEPLQFVPIHGDLNPSQFLFEQEQPVLIDFDTFGMGDPALDVAHFIAGLYRTLLHGMSSLADVEAGRAAFLDAYHDSVPWTICGERLRVFLAAVLLYRTAYKVLRRLEPEGARKIAQCTALAVRHLSNI